MKKFNIIPLMMIVPLLGACNGSGVKKMSKPKFASYSNKVEADKFSEDANKAGEEAFKPCFVYDGDKIVSIDKGAALTMKQYKSVQYKSTLKTGNKQSYSSEYSAQSTSQIDATNLVAKGVMEMAQEASTKNVDGEPSATIVPIGEQSIAVLYSIPEFGSVDGKMSGSQKEETYSFYQGKNQISADATTKTYTKSPLEVEEAKQKENFALGAYMALTMTMTQFLPSDNINAKYDRYEDGQVYTSCLKSEGKELSYTYGDEQVKVTSKLERIYQIDFAKLKAFYSEEITIEMSKDDIGTLNYSSKEYRTFEYANKKVSAKAPDISKYTENTTLGL